MNTNDKNRTKGEVLSRESDQLQRPGKLQRRRWMLVLAILLAVVFGPYVYSRCWAPASRINLQFDKSIALKFPVSDTSQVKTLTGNKFGIKVASFNIAHGRGTAAGNWSESAQPKFDRIQKIATKIREIDADIVVLNEVDFESTWSGHQNQAAAIAETAGYPYRVEQRNLDFRFIYGSFRFGNAILSRYPITDAQAIEFPAEKNWEDWLVGSKRGVLASVRLNQSQRLRVAAVHLEHRSEATRVAGAETILQLLDPSGKNPLIAAGDFNSTPTGYPKSITNGSGVNAMDRLLKNGQFHYRPTDAPAAEQLTFSTMDPASVIDWILVSRVPDQEDESPMAKYEVMDTELSDHRIVVAEINLEVPPRSQ